MGEFERSVELLDYPESDLWSDILACEARAIIDNDIHQMISLVLACWRQWPEHRLEHLAYVLGESAAPLEQRVIDELLESPYPSVIARAIEAAGDYSGKT